MREETEKNFQEGIGKMRNLREKIVLCNKKELFKSMM